VQALQWRLTALGAGLEGQATGGGATPSPRGGGNPAEGASLQSAAPATLGRSLATRPAYFDGALRDTPVIRRERLPVGAERAGPLLVEEDASTTVVPPGWRLTVQPSGHLDLRRAP
jgi:N-methylhydantoinase A/oxoprolinase/acetone carboxylase beta subunit